MRKLILLLVSMLLCFQNSTLIFAASLPSPKIPDSIGVALNLGATGTDLDRVKAAGIRIARSDFTWANIEKQKGVYNFSYYDQLINGLIQRGIKPMFILDYSNKLYEPTVSVRTVAGRQAFAKFAAAAAARYKGRGVIWEIWNEPDDWPDYWLPASNPTEYMALVKAVVPAIRQADPSATIVAPAVSGLSSTELSYLQACFSQGLLGLVDAVTVHPYHDYPTGPERIPGEVQNLRSLIAKYNNGNANFPVIASEVGYNTATASEQTQAALIVRTHLMNLSSGMIGSVWYDWHDYEAAPSSKWDRAGLVRYNETLKPSYYSLQAMTKALNGKSFVKRLPSASTDYLLQFSDGTNTTVAAWTTSASHSVQIASGVSKTLTGTPVFVTVSSVPVQTTSVPAAPTNLALVSITKGTTSGNYYVNIKWTDNATNETGYEIYQSINSTSNFKIIKTPAANAAGYGINIGAAPVKGTYYYKVYAVNSAGRSQPSNTIAVTIP